MNPTLGLLMPLMLGQPAGPGCARAPPTRAPLTAPYSLIAQPPYFKQVCPPSGPPAPVLAVRAVLAEKMTLTVTPSDPKSPAHGTGATFGFRPGYQYRLRIDNIPDHAGESLYPVLEVRSSIVPRPGMKYMEFPASFTITKEDVERAFAGRMVSKVIYLENPERAVPFESSADKPIEVGSDTFERALREAEENGRIVAIIRLGDRTPAADELARIAVAGTVLQPGDASLAPAAAPPHFGYTGTPLYDPILGPKSSDLECFLNGGDVNANLGVGPDGTVQPFRATNTIAEYSTGLKRRFSKSNEVCICSPRFVIRKVDIGVNAVQQAGGAGAATQVTGRDVFQQRAFTQALFGRERLMAMDARVRPSQAVELVGLHAFASKTKPSGFGKVEGTLSLFTVAEVDELTNFPAQLVLTKTVEPAGPAQQGDVLTITLRYYNNTRQPVTDLILSDSLSGRLEYIAGSAKADRPSNVTVATNEAGSQVVRFELPGQLPPTGSGLVVFQVKVR